MTTETQNVLITVIGMFVALAVGFYIGQSSPHMGMSDADHQAMMGMMGTHDDSGTSAHTHGGETTTVGGAMEKMGGATN